MRIRAGGNFALIAPATDGQTSLEIRYERLKSRRVSAGADHLDKLMIAAAIGSIESICHSGQRCFWPLPTIPAMDRHPLSVSDEEWHSAAATLRVAAPKTRYRHLARCLFRARALNHDTVCPRSVFSLLHVAISGRGEGGVLAVPLLAGSNRLETRGSCSLLLKASTAFRRLNAGSQTMGRAFKGR